MRDKSKIIRVANFRTPTLSLKKRSVEGNLKFRFTCFSFDISLKTKGLCYKSLETKRFFSYPRFFGISAFLKGFISWLQRCQYTEGDRIHQINPECLSPGNSRWFIIYSGSGLTQPQTGQYRRPHLAYQVLRLESPIRPGLPNRRSGLSLRSDAIPCQWDKMKTIGRILGEKTQRKNLNPPSPRSKGTQESFRRGPRGWAETPKTWNCRKAYKVHLYWSDNLKYAR